MEINDKLLLNTIEEYQRLENTLDELVSEGILYYSERKNKYLLLENSHLVKGDLILNDKGFGFIEIGKDKASRLIKEKEKRAMKKDVFESDEERIKFQSDMMNRKKEREEVEMIDVEGISSVPETLSAVDPTTTMEEEKEAVTEEINKFYVDIEKRIKPEMTWHQKDSVKGIIQMNLYFGRITNEEAKKLSEMNNCSRLCMVNVK